MPPVSTDTISVVCPCGKKLKAPASAAGKKAKCPSCGNVMKLEAPAGASSAAPSVPPVPAEALKAAKAAKPAGAVTAKKVAVPPPPPTDHADDGGDDLGGLYELAAVEKQARAAGAVDDSPRCSKCFSELPAGAVLCTNCGFDLRTRKALTTTRADAAPPALKPLGGGVFGSKPAKAAKAPRADSGEGNFFLGIVFGVLFSLGGAAVYGAATYFLDAIPFVGWITGWLVLMVGALAGFGVDKGYKGGNVLAGLTAAGITLCTVLITKFVVLAALIAPTVKHAMDNAALERWDPAVHSMVLDEEFKKHNVSKHGAPIETITAYSQIASDRIKKMSDSEYAAYQKKSAGYETREELSGYVRDDILKEKKLDPLSAPKEERIKAADEADTRIAAMSDAEATQKLKVYDAAAEEKLKAEFAAEASKHHDTSSSSDEEDDGGGKTHSGPSGSLIGFGIILALIFFVWLFLPTVIAMLIAYRVAANA